MERAFFAVRFSRVLDALGHARFRAWRLYGEEGLARKQAAIWLQSGSLTIEHGGEPLSRYDVELVARIGELKAIGRARPYETSHRRNYPQLRVFALEEAGWIKALKLDGYAPRGSRQPRALQVSLFPFLAGTGA